MIELCGRVSFVLALGAVACGGADGSEDFLEDEPIESLEEAVRDGTEGGGVGTVEVGRCSGTLVGNHMVLTAAHCFDAKNELGNDLTGPVTISISLAVTGRTWRCLSGGPTTSSGKCKEARRVWVRRLKRSDAVDDLAVVFTITPGGRFQNLQVADGASKLYTGSLSSSEKYTFYGRGPFHYDGSGAGVMRFMHDSLNWRGAGHFITDADGVRPCMGDSGGPYFLRGTRSIFGVLSEADASGQCAKVGGKIAGARITEKHLEKINRFRTDEGLEPCRRMLLSPDHWTCG
jgi:hypothetical protein